jgi:hypothetical protein
VPPIAPVRHQYGQPAAFFSAFLAFSDGTHETPPTLRPHVSKSGDRRQLGLQLMNNGFWLGVCQKTHLP